MLSHFKTLKERRLPHIRHLSYHCVDVFMEKNYVSFYLPHMGVIRQARKPLLLVNEGRKQHQAYMKEKQRTMQAMK